MNAFLNKQIGWIGTGVMGKSMCMHLLNKNLKVNIYTRTQEKAQSLI
jgi:3-hydroxyisobutyrate dehydrogenase